MAPPLRRRFPGPAADCREGIQMKKRNISEALGILISLSGALVMAGWLLDIEAIKSIRPGWESMKFPTALSFFFYGIALSFIARFRKKESALAVIVIPILSTVILLLMASLLASTLIGAHISASEMFIRYPAENSGSAPPGIPSVATMMNFILLAFAGFLTTMDIRRLNRAPAVLVAIAAAVGLLAVLGYVTDRPSLYFAVSGKSSPMALHAAILFVLCGTGAVLAERNG
jgi:hypothetical protein